MTFVRLVVGAIVLGAEALVVAQEAPSVCGEFACWRPTSRPSRPFYAKTFGLSEVARPVNSATTTEVILNVGATPDMARKATTAPVVIFTRPASAPAGAMASLILSVADLEKTIEAVKANGGTLMRGPNRNAVMNLSYAFAKDPDGNQIELIMEAM